MVYLPPPTARGEGSSNRRSYNHAYNKILNAHRTNPLASASSVVLLVAPDVDALCAARMFASLFRQDDVMYQIKPVSGIAELEHVRDELMTSSELHTLILLNMGAILDLPSSEWFGDFDPKVTVHVVDSTRPQNLSSLFGGGENGERIVLWDDGGADKLGNERKAWEALMYEPEPDSDEEDNSDDDDPSLEDDEDEEDYDQQPGKRRSLGEGERKSGKRRRIDDPDKPKRMTHDERDGYAARLEKHYMAGTWYGQSAAGTIFMLATSLERVDNDSLWMAILGLTHQYTTSRISRTLYDDWHAVYNDEVCRLNALAVSAAGETPSTSSLVAATPDDMSLRVTEEFRFMLFRHWNLYDAMFHSSYVASKLGIWKEKGRKRLTGLLAKMGFSIIQTQQSYAHMDMKLKDSLHTRLAGTAPEYGLVELYYPSFAHCFGYIASPMSASDVVEGISTLLDVAGGVKMEVDIEGGRHGGEWFGGSKAWEGINGLAGDRKDRDERKRRVEERENVPPGGTAANGGKTGNEAEGEDREGRADVDWWLKNFWIAYDALTNVTILKESLPLAMALHKAIIRTGTSIIDKQDIKTMRHHHVVVLTQGPDLALFAHPGVLARLALWLVDALRERLEPSSARERAGLGSGKKKSLPFVVACLNEVSGTYVVVGVMAAMEFGDVRKNEFGLAFLDAKERCNARTRHGSFDTSVLEINRADLNMFLETLCEGPE